MNSIIETKDLKLWYGDHQVLKGITMDIPEHQITALIGPSGCGKSTFLKTLNRMNDLVENVRITGEVKYDGKDIFSSNANVNELRKEIGMVFQKPNPFPMSIYDNVAFGPRTHGIRSKVKLDEIVERSLRDAALWDEVKDRLKTSALGMSGGQQQRLCIARALAVQPKVILCDESTASLDPISTGKIEDLLMEAGIYHRYFLTKKAYYEMVELQNRGILRFQRQALVLEGTLHYLPVQTFFRDRE